MRIIEFWRYFRTMIPYKKTNDELLVLLQLVFSFQSLTWTIKQQWQCRSLLCCVFLGSNLSIRPTSFIRFGTIPWVSTNATFPPILLVLSCKSTTVQFMIVVICCCVETISEKINKKIQIISRRTFFKETVAQRIKKLETSLFDNDGAAAL